jgi:hypothetical protein
MALLTLKLEQTDEEQELTFAGCLGRIKTKQGRFVFFCNDVNNDFFGHFWPNAKPFYGRPNRLVPTFS